METPPVILTQHLDPLIVRTNLSARPERAHVSQKSFLHELLMNVLWVRLPIQTSTPRPSQKSKVPSEFIMAKMTLC